MDESSDFQDKRKKITGPKAAPKKANKPRKVPKRIRGQKDIRTVLKTKTELETYSKDFDKVCKQAGIDVDSEQLQLAIALSKSLQTVEPCDENAQSTSTHERVSKIRTTLLEYGFKVPDLKITASKKLRKHRKNYKLLLTSETEKQQIIANKYAKLLFEDISYSKSISDLDFTDKQLYYLATNATYKILRNNNNLYVSNLIEKSTSTGSLLRNWSEIPGRPVSPVLTESIKMNFSEIECSQEELDTVLSGALKSCKNVMRKYAKIVECNEDVNNPVRSNDSDLKNIENPIIIIDDNLQSDLNGKTSKSSDVIDLIKLNTDSNQYRSCSPDLFDDDNSVVEFRKNNTSLGTETLKETNQLDTNKDNNLGNCDQLIPALKVNATVSNYTKRASNDFMEMTECVQHINMTSKLCSQSDNKTQRKSNDFMEITDCVPRAPQDCNVDLTQSPEDNIERNSPENMCVVLDKTMRSPTKIFVKDDLIDLTQDPEHSIKVKKDNVDLDLTQSSNTSEELPAVILSSKEKSVDETIIMDPLEYEDINKVNNSDILEVTDIEIGAEAINPPNTRFFEEFLHNHSDDNPRYSSDHDEKIDLTQNMARNLNSEETENSDIDLTQTSESECSQINDRSLDLEEITKEHLIEKDSPKNKTLLRYSSLGKKDNISIDYDEMIEEVTSTNSNKSVSSNHEENKDYDSIVSKEINKIDTNTNGETAPSNHDVSNEVVTNHLEDDLAIINDFEMNYSSQTSEVFEISDKELDYSINRSKLLERQENFNFGGISVLDDMSKVGSHRISTKKSDNIESIDVVNKNDSAIEVEKYVLDNNEISPIKHKRINEISTPQRASTSGTLVETPNNSKFILKTNNVTPMPHYEIMSTPEIHKELDKYGIKPFKRKRAIQLLSHIYNQTHPFIEYSSPKRRKLKDTFSPKKHKLSPRKLIQSPPKTAENVTNSEHRAIESKEIFYEETNDPVIKEIQASEDDWVFQKREKAKVHTCRLPLHIAFHNYVTSRQGLYEAILCYQPINIDIIHKDLVRYGHRYDPKDLLKFLDKKCITVKTTDNNARNKR